MLSFRLTSTAASGSRFVLHTSGSGLPWSTLFRPLPHLLRVVLMEPAVLYLGAAKKFWEFAGTVWGSRLGGPQGCPPFLKHPVQVPHPAGRSTWRQTFEQL